MNINEDQLNKHINQMSFFRRSLICFLNFKRWRLAVAYNKVCADLMVSGEKDAMAIYEQIRERMNAAWHNVYF